LWATKKISAGKLFSVVYKSACKFSAVCPILIIYKAWYTWAFGGPNSVIKTIGRLPVLRAE
jgi:hypothetical protein